MTRRGKRPVMYEAFEVFLNKPTAANYLRVRSLLLNDPQFQPKFERRAELEDLHQAKRYRQLCRKAARLMPQWALCPRLHLLAAHAAQQLGEHEDAELESFMAAACLQGLLATGKGTVRRPYLITYGGDQYDVLHWQGHRVTSQLLVQRKGRHLDVITCEDGSQVFFDVTSLFRHQPALSEPLLAR